MLNASDSLKKVINNDSRYITTTVKIYFDGVNKPPIVFTDDEIVELEILEEVASEADIPIGNVCSNEFTLELLNTNQRFTMTNKDSDLYGKILPGVRCDVLFNVYIKDDYYETIPMGTYYLEDCKASSGSMSATITAYDRLYSLYDLDCPNIPMQHNISIGELFKLFFTELGMIEGKDYIIDNSLSSIIPIAWLSGDNIGECIKLLSTSCACLVYVNRHNQIVVKDQLRLTYSDVIISEDEQIYSIKNLPSYQEMRSSVVLEYTIPSVTTKPINLLSLTNLTLQPGINEFKKLKFNSVPVISVTGISVTKGSHVTISDYKTSANSVDITITNNSGQEQVIDLTVEGTLLNLTKSSVSKTNDNLIGVIGDRPVKVSSYLLQSGSVSHEYINMLSSLVSNFGSNIEMELRGNPLIEIADIINVYAPSYNITEKVIPIRVKYNLSEGLTSSMLCVKLDSKLHMDNVFISPGLVVSTSRDNTYIEK